MPAKTDLNVSPYYDDFNTLDDFHKVLFRPGFAIQARELTTAQSILQNQVEQFGNHIFEEGSIVIPGSVGYDSKYYAVKLQATFSSSTVSDYLSTYDGAIITGATSGVTAQVIGYSVADSATGDPDTLFVKYLSTNTTDNSTTTFNNSESISANKTINGISAGTISATLEATAATATGSAVTVLAGVYFVRGFMVQNTEQTLVLEKYSNVPSYRVGWTVTETLVTPENDSTLQDNAQGTSNYAAKGGHRLKISLTLAKKSLTTTEDSDFIELARIENGLLVHKMKYTEYSVIEDMLARRTNDESGDYVVKHFAIEPREHLASATNRGLYSAAQGGDETKAAFSIGPGKAYVDGYEIEQQGTQIVPFDKARTTKNIQNDAVPADMGQFVKVDNVYSLPELTESGSTLNPFGAVKLYDQQTSSRGSASGAYIGDARTRGFEYYSGTVGNVAAIHHHYLFDITMFTSVVVDTATVTLTADALVTGSTSGATGYVVASVSSASAFFLRQVEGTFVDNELITSSISTNTTTNAQIVAATTVQKNFARDVKQIFFDTAAAGQVDYTADVVLDQSKDLAGTISYVGSGTTVTGLNTEFTTSLVVGDIVSFPSGASGAQEERRVTAVTNDTTITIASALTNALTNATAKRKRGKLHEEEEVVLVYKMPRDNIKTLLDSGGTSDTSYNYKKQFPPATTNSSGVCTFSVSSGHTFAAPSVASNYVAVITTAGSGSGAVGDVVDITSTATGSGTTTLTITDNTVFGNAAKVEIIGTVAFAVSTQKSKTAQKMTTKTIVASVAADSGALKQIYGERVADKEISLSFADVYKLHAVYESTAIGTAAAAPTLTTVNATGTFTVGETITGDQTGATGTVLSVAGATLTYVKVTGTFSTLDTISGGTSGFNATLSATTAGSKNITSDFLLDTGQRDSFYDIGRIVRKAGAQAPIGQLLIVYDYCTHGSGDYFSVDSYTGQIDYDKIPEYYAEKVDPSSRSPKGLYPLRDCLDFRSRVKDQSSPSISPFSFNAKDFEGTGAVNGNLVSPDTNVTMDYDFYLGRRDLLYLDKTGNWLTEAGTPAENPIWPATDNQNMLVGRYDVPAYTFDPDDIRLLRQTNKGYQMQDIGNLEQRIAKLEYTTALGLLERETESYQVLDGDGLSRFKSGLIVDNFAGHNIGYASYADYKCSVDPSQGHLRPVGVQKFVNLIEENTTDGQRTTDGYQKTGELVTLPYTEYDEVIQPYASRVESVNPYSVTAWIGNITLTPDQDVWMDDIRVPAVTINVQGNYEQLLREQTEAGALGTVWNSWNTIWRGEERVLNVNSGSGELWGGQGTTTTTSEVDIRQRRSGTETRLIERIDNISTGDRIVNIEVIPFMRSRSVDFVAKNMKPNTRVYAFFDRVDVNVDCKPTGSSSNNTTLNGAHTKAVTTLTVASTTGFADTGSLVIGDLTATELFGLATSTGEVVTYTGKTATTFTGVTRNSDFALDEAKSHATGVAVSDAVKGNKLVTNSVGTINGTFVIPNTDIKRFRVGRRPFRLTGSSTDSRVVGQASTAAEKEFFAQGMRQTKQEVIAAVRNGEVVSRDVEEEVATTQLVVRTQAGGWYDPLAQTIMCDRPEGMFLSSVDLFFSAKDTSLPVWIEVRTVKNGYPSQTILPFSVKQLEPASVNIDATTGATATNFAFDSPVYLTQGNEYAIVVASNSPEYKVWISRLGELDIGGTRAIASQPHLGSLFKSQNASTWTASQFEDLKFTMKRCKFTTDTTGQFTVVNEELSQANGYVPVLADGPVESVSGQSIVKINAKNHGLHSTSSNVDVRGVKSDVGNTALNGALTNSATTVVVDDQSNFPTAGTIKIDDELITYTGKTSTTQLTGATRGTADHTGTSTTAVAHDDDSIVELYMFAGIPLIEINKTHTAVAGVELDSFLLETPTTNATSTTRGGGDAVRITKNILADVVQPVIEHQLLPKNTTLTASLQATTGKSLQGSETAYSRTALGSAFSVPLNQDYYFDNPHLIASQINETNEMSGNKSFRLSMDMSTDLDNVSPVIDTKRMGVICVSNRLNDIDSSSDVNTTFSNYTAQTVASGDNNAAIYMTKKITIQQSATALKVYLDAVNQSTADINVLYKIQRLDETIPFDDLPWVMFTGSGGTADGQPTTAVTASKNRDDFKEYKYLAGLAEDGTGTALDEFNAFSIKIVMQGTSSSKPPIIKDFRTIALAT